MSKKISPFLLAFIFILSACGSNDIDNNYIDSATNNQTMSLKEKEFVHKLFLTEYLWYDQVASNIDYTPLKSPQIMINTLKVSPPDKWSFSMTAEEYENFANQKTAGFGFSYSTDFTIYFVRIDSPAYGKLHRVDKILEINTMPVTSTLISSASQNINKETTFTILRASQEREVKVTANEYSFKVSLGKIIQQGTKSVGYLRYDSFTESSVAEFEKIFDTFSSANIDELVIDLRYNGGGSISTASALLDNITNAYTGKRQVYLDWNPNYQGRNTNYYFEDADLQDGNELNMKRVIFLVTQGSASASELIISALTPYLGDNNIITIGDITHGKPVGMSDRTYEQNYYFLINFIVKNNANETTPFGGIAVTCPAVDDITHIMGDENETMLKTALHYVETGNCL